ncbi:MAG: hypothetical protein PSX36_11240 [bacterium]|nr:hypothetical protein [bacterium]
MTNFIIYSIELAICLALFYSIYWAFLKNETFFKLNRIYLISSVLLSLTMPLLKIDISKMTGSASFITKNFILPIERYEQRISGNPFPEIASTNSELNLPAIDEANSNDKVAGDKKYIYTQTGATDSFKVSGSDKNFNWLQIGNSA